MKYFGAVDPGAKGGYAIIDEQGEHIFSAQFSNWKAVGTFLQSYPMLLAIEEVHAMPGNGVSSMFAFGKNAGGYDALAEFLDISVILVKPQKWMKAILGTFPKGESKERALAYINRRYPTLNLKKKDSGVIDALCLALYIRDKN